MSWTDSEVRFMMPAWPAHPQGYVKTMMGGVQSASLIGLYWTEQQ